jgi:DNA-binding response OmpR family regulator
VPRILLIDDTPEIAELLTFSLRDLGYEVFASGFTEAVNDLIAQQRAAAVVLDCTAFDMSESLFDSVRHHPDHAELPIVIISDTPEQAEASLRSRKARKVLLVPKPFTGAQVARALAQLLE